MKELILSGQDPGYVENALPDALVNILELFMSNDIFKKHIDLIEKEGLGTNIPAVMLAYSNKILSDAFEKLAYSDPEQKKVIKTQKQIVRVFKN